MGKHKVVGQKLRDESDPSLARVHKEGAVVQKVQPAKDNRWGRYYFNHYQRYYLILNEARKHYNRTIYYLKQCRKVKVDEVRGTRHVEDSLRDKLEIHSMQFLILTKLGYEYMTHEMLPSVDYIQYKIQGILREDWDKVELLDRLKALVTRLNIKTKIPPKLFELFDRRDIVEHPLSYRLYNSTENGWKNNHLAWILSGEVDGVWTEIINFTNEIIETFANYVKNNPIPGTLGIKRGLKSIDPYKK
jgi:hypothetical protein